MRALESGLALIGMRVLVPGLVPVDTSEWHVPLAEDRGFGKLCQSCPSTWLPGSEVQAPGPVELRVSKKHPEDPGGGKAGG